MQCQTHRESRCCSFCCSTVHTPWLYSIYTVMNMLNIHLVPMASPIILTQIRVDLLRKFRKVFLALKYLVQEPLIFTSDDGLWGEMVSQPYNLVPVLLLVPPLMVLSGRKRYCELC